MSGDFALESNGVTSMEELNQSTPDTKPESMKSTQSIATADVVKKNDGLDNFFCNMPSFFQKTSSMVYRKQLSSGWMLFFY